MIFPEYQQHTDEYGRVWYVDSVTNQWVQYPTEEEKHSPEKEPFNAPEVTPLPSEGAEVQTPITTLEPILPTGGSSDASSEPISFQAGIPAVSPEVSKPEMEQLGPGSRRESESSHAMPSPPPMMQPPMFNPMGSTASVLTPPSIPTMPTNSLTKRPSLDAQKSISPPTVSAAIDFIMRKLDIMFFPSAITLLV